jgi:hypothetical protein
MLGCLLMTSVLTLKLCLHLLHLTLPQIHLLYLLESHCLYQIHALPFLQPNIFLPLHVPLHWMKYQLVLTESIDSQLFMQSSITHKVSLSSILKQAHQRAMQLPISLPLLVTQTQWNSTSLSSTSSTHLVTVMVA